MTSRGSNPVLFTQTVGENITIEMGEEGNISTVRGDSHAQMWEDLPVHVDSAQGAELAVALLMPAAAALVVIDGGL